MLIFVIDLKPLAAMRYVALPDDDSRRLPFYLAMEEYVARAVAAPDDLFFMWQVEPTVIFGRNQIIDNEVDCDYCRRNGINVYRRKSGGGCVYADMDNIMFSYITPSDSPVATIFSSYTSMVASMLRSLGLDASASSRNDVMIGGRKVSGNAFYHTPTHSIVHGTMLFDTDMERMASAITPSKSKLSSKGVASVDSRITTIRRHLEMGIEEFKQYVRDYLCDGELRLTEADVEAIKVIEKPYYDDAWIYHRKAAGHRRALKRIEGVGEFQVDLTLGSDGTIRDLDLTGDFFLLGDMGSLIVDRLRGVRHDPAAVAEALESCSVGNVIYGLTDKQLIELLF